MRIMANTEDSIDDDVFETVEDTNNSNLKINQNSNQLRSTPSPTGYRDYKPPAEVLKLCENDTIEDTNQRVHKVIIWNNYINFYLLSAKTCVLLHHYLVNNRILQNCVLLIQPLLL